ncbi:MAG: MerR family transcriptional regulator [Spirochaetales bacterium]|nr:MerR family transcriptional regulator [Spirochaetales bacterium]
MLTVKQIAEAAGVSSRTIRYYDLSGLLPPTRIGANGYRYYEQEAILKLQQILFYRELGFSLEEIGEIIHEEGFNLIEALAEHRLKLREKVNRLERLVSTVDNTILHLQEGLYMKAEDVFRGFSEEEQVKYEKAAAARYDPDIVQASNRRWNSYSRERQAEILNGSNEIYNEFKALIPACPYSNEVMATVFKWRKSIEHFWTPSLEQLPGLAETYSVDPRFKEKFDKMDPLLAGFIYEAVKNYVEIETGITGN